MLLCKKSHLIVLIVNFYLIISFYSLNAFANVTIILKGNIVDKSCELDFSNTTIDVEMGQWIKTKTWTEGYIFGSREFNVLLNKCGESAHFATFRFIDTTMTSGSVFFSVGSEVKGIALQLKDSEGNIINNDSNVTVNIRPKQSNFISFGAHYIVISDSIIPGKATSKVYFYIEYP